MPPQTVFRRYELKYLLTDAQKQTLLAAMQPYMHLDQYGRSTIRNIYYDTPDHLLIRRSIEKPVYKEKLRIRTYSRAQADSPVFVELKKKYDDVVYKRRICLPQAQATAWLGEQTAPPVQGQIPDEIAYFLRFYGCVRPSVFLSYEREAYYSRDGSDFRVTFDDNILCRRDDLCLCSPVGGTPLLPRGTVLMEIKCTGGIPLWMAHLLSREKIFKTSYSKYGTAYRELIFPQSNQHATKETV